MRKNRLTTRRQTKTLRLLFEEIWLDNEKDKKQRGTAVNNWRQSLEAKKAEKSSDDAATDGEVGASVP